jgi:serine/threonine-protein kinase
MACIALDQEVPALIGDYQIVEAVGVTDAGRLYEAEHIILPRRASITVSHTADPRSTLQVLREAVMLEVLAHPGVIRLYEVGALADRRRWLAHERPVGPTLDTCAGSSLRDALALLRDVAEVIEHVHSRGIVHCGLRPDRIVLTGGVRAFPLCISDFVAARPHDASPRKALGAVPMDHYAAPELARGEAVDGKVDVFSLGVIAYELLTGVAPFAAESWSEVVPVAAHLAGAPPELSDLVSQMLDHDPAQRPLAARAYAELARLAELPIALEPDPIELEPDPIELEPAMVAMPRIRRPRWTPPVDAGLSDPDLGDPFWINFDKLT